MNSATIAEPWDKEIVPRRGWWDVPVRELWRYRDLVLLLALRDLSAQYKQTVAGPLWFVLQPLIATAMFSLLFGRMAGLSTDGTPHFLFYMAGMTVWNFFAECVNKSAYTLVRSAHIFGKVYFPRLAVPLAGVATTAAAFLIQFAIFLAGLGFYLWKARVDPAVHVDPNWRIVLLPLLIAQAAMLGVGVGLVISAITTKYRDLMLGVGFAVQLWMYGSSVVFPLSAIHGDRLRHLVACNPMVPIIEAVRFAFLGQGLVTKAQLATSAAVSVGMLVAGVLLFNRTEQSAMDSV